MATTRSPARRATYVIAALRYAITAPWWVEGEVQWTPEAIPIDNANTFYSDPYAVVNVRSNYAVSPGFSVYGEVRNLFDVDYAGATLVLGRVTQPFQAVFLPGDGRAFYAGTRVRFGALFPQRGNGDAQPAGDHHHPAGRRGVGEQPRGKKRPRRKVAGEQGAAGQQQRRGQREHPAPSRQRQRRQAACITSRSPAV